jgi:hypothetical protein
MIMNTLTVLSLLIICSSVASKKSDTDIELCNDEKCFKNLLKTRPNLLVLFSKSGK